MFQFALYNWNPSHAPVNITYVQQATFAGSQFPASLMDRAYVSESGPTLGIGPQTRGKRIVEFTQNAAGAVTAGPTKLVEYAGNGAGSVVGLATGPDGLYFSSLYNDDAKSAADVALAIGPGAKVYRVRYVNPLLGDYDIDGDVDSQDYNPYRSAFGSNYLLASDGNRDNVVSAADYVVWRKFTSSSGASILATAETEDSSSPTLAAAPVAQPASLAAAPVDAAFATLSTKHFNKHSARTTLRTNQLFNSLATRDNLMRLPQPIVAEDPDSASDFQCFDEVANDRHGAADVDGAFSQLLSETLFKSLRSAADARLHRW
jgi:hypothetical protein